jgi:hypothetical protein
MIPAAFRYLAAYSVALFLAHYAVGWLLLQIRKHTKQKDKAHPLDFWIGATERTITTTLVIFAPPYVAPFIGAWVAFKIAANWQRLKNSDKTRKGTLIALVGNALSFSTAILCGLIVNPGALHVWATK